MSPNIREKIIVTVWYYGLGYPPGYRPLDTEVSFPWNDTKWCLEIETPKGHHARWHDHTVDNETIFPEFQHPGECTVGTVRRAYRETGSETVYAVIIDGEELTTGHVKQAVQMFFDFQHTEVPEITLASLHDTHDLEDEFQVWEKDHHRFLEWLRKGAPPYKLSFASHAVEDILDISETALDQEDELMLSMGFTQDDDGRWMKEPELVIYEPREWYEEALRTLAQEKGDVGPHYLSLGSWPAGVGFVANGKRYGTKRPPVTKERAWYGYLANSNRVVLFRSRSDVEIIDIDGQLDIMPALEKV